MKKRKYNPLLVTKDVFENSLDSLVAACKKEQLELSFKAYVSHDTFSESEQCIVREPYTLRRIVNAESQEHDQPRKLWDTANLSELCSVLVEHLGEDMSSMDRTHAVRIIERMAQNEQQGSVDVAREQRHINPILAAQRMAKTESYAQLKLLKTLLEEHDIVYESVLTYKDDKCSGTITYTSNNLLEH